MRILKGPTKGTRFNVKSSNKEFVNIKLTNMDSKS